MDSVFTLIFSGVASIVDILSNKFVISFGGFSFSLWDFYIACALLSVLVPLLLITRSRPPIGGGRGSERNNSRGGEDDD